MQLTVYSINGVTPVVDPDAFVHPSAVLIGDVIDRAAAHAGRRDSRTDRPRTFGHRARMENRRDSQLPGSHATKPRHDARNGAPYDTRAESQAHRPARIAAAVHAEEAVCLRQCASVQ